MSNSPPATLKFALAPLLMMNPPPVRKSQSAFAAPLASARASAAMPGARRVQIARMIIPPLLNGRAVEREIAENGAAGCAAHSRLGLSEYGIGADAGRAHAKRQVAERSLR